MPTLNTLPSSSAIENIVGSLSTEKKEKFCKSDAEYIAEAERALKSKDYSRAGENYLAIAYESMSTETPTSLRKASTYFTLASDCFMSDYELKSGKKGALESAIIHREIARSCRHGAKDLEKESNGKNNF